MLSIALLAPLFRLSPRRAVRLAAACVLVGLGLAASVQLAEAEEAAAPLDAAVLEQVKALAIGKTAEPAQAGSPRIELVVGQLDSRLRLAPCERVEPYVPPNTRLWGKSRIGLRCARGAVAWNVYLPITVKAWGQALVLPAGGTIGSVVAEADLAQAEVDLAEEPSPAVLDRRAVVGRVLAQPLRPGQALRLAHVKARQYFAAGETVRVVALGDGFALESLGQALTNGFEGQTARVRTENGAVVTGSPSGERRMEFAP